MGWEGNSLSVFQNRDLTLVITSRDCDIDHKTTIDGINYGKRANHYDMCSAAQCQIFQFNSISAISNSIFDIIGLARTSQQYHQRFFRTNKNYNFCINFIKMLFNILKIIPIFGDFVIRYRFSMLFDAGSSTFLNRFWIHIWCRFDILKYCAALDMWNGKWRQSLEPYVLLLLQSSIRL